MARSDVNKFLARVMTSWGRVCFLKGVVAGLELARGQRDPKLIDAMLDSARQRFRDRSDEHQREYGTDPMGSVRDNVDRIANAIED